MAYIKNTWVDQAGQVRYAETEDEGYKIFTANYDEVTELGTPVNAVNMNHIEQGIYDNDTHIGDLTQLETTVKTDLVNAINENVNGKADVDLTNVNNSGTSKVAGWAMPSSTNEDVTLGANGATYTAPANGWFTLVGYNGNAGSTTLLNETSSVITMTGSPTSAYYAELSVPCAKNDVIQLSWHNGNLFIPAEGWFKFVYAKGSESEAQ